MDASRMRDDARCRECRQSVSAERTVCDERGLFLLLVKSIERIIPAPPHVPLIRFWIQKVKT